MAQAVYGYLHQFEMTSDMSMMSFLPLAHIYEVCQLVSSSLLIF